MGSVLIRILVAGVFHVKQFLGIRSEELSASRRMTVEHSPRCSTWNVLCVSVGVPTKLSSEVGGMFHVEHSNAL